MQARKLPAWCKIRYNLSDSGLLWLQEKPGRKPVLVPHIAIRQAIFIDYNALQTFSTVLYISVLKKVVIIHTYEAAL